MLHIKFAIELCTSTSVKQINFVAIQKLSQKLKLEKGSKDVKGQFQHFEGRSEVS